MRSQASENSPASRCVRRRHHHQATPGRRLSATSGSTQATRWLLASAGLTTLVCLLVAPANCSPWRRVGAASEPEQVAPVQRQARLAPLAGRRAADDSRPLTRQASEAQIVVGKFKAPAPEQVHHQRLAKSSQSGAQVVGASFRVAEPSEPQPELFGPMGATGKQRREPKLRQVSAKIQVSDEGMDLPPSKLSADIYGNVAEIVTAPPELVDNDFLLATSSRFGRRA